MVVHFLDGLQYQLEERGRKKLANFVKIPKIFWAGKNLLEDPSRENVIGLLASLGEAAFRYGKHLDLPLEVFWELIKLQLFFAGGMVAPEDQRLASARKRTMGPLPRRYFGYHSPEQLEKIKRDFDERDQKVFQERAGQVASSLGWRPVTWQWEKPHTAEEQQAFEKEKDKEDRKSMAAALAKGLKNSKLDDPYKKWAEDWLPKNSD